MACRDRSLIGAIVGAAVLAASIPIVRPLVLAFGSPEFLGLAIMGIMFVAVLMVWLDWPRPPLVLGLVLGKLAESNLFISFARYDWAFITRPLLVAIIGVGVVIVFAPMLRERLARKAGVEADQLVSEAS